MRPAVICSSRTGNTRFLAERLAARHGLPLHSVRDVPAVPAGIPLVLGWWTWRGGPDRAMLDFMDTVCGRDVFWFCTMTAYTDSEHAGNVRARARSLLESRGCRVAGHFLCRGRLDPAVLAVSRHPMTPERMERIRSAESHPESADAEALSEAFMAAAGHWLI